MLFWVVLNIIVYVQVFLLSFILISYFLVRKVYIVKIERQPLPLVGLASYGGVTLILWLHPPITNFHTLAPMRHKMAAITSGTFWPPVCAVGGNSHTLPLFFSL